MHISSKTVASLDELLTAASDEQVSRIVVCGTIADAPSIRLSRGQQLVGENENAHILFRPDVDGLEITSDNEVRTIRLQAAPHQRAVYNDTSIQTLGNLMLDHVTTIGQVQLLAKDHVRGGHVSVNGLDIVAADAHARSARPHGYGVHVLQGVFTLWNQQSAEQAVLTADLVGISLGRENAPVIGSGVFVSGADFTGTSLQVSRLETDTIFVDGKIPQGTADLITGGVFVVHGAHVDEVRTHEEANGHHSDAVYIEGGSVGLEGLDIKAADGIALRLKDAYLSKLAAVGAQGSAGDVVVESRSQVKTDAESVEELSQTSGKVLYLLQPSSHLLQTFRELPI